MGPVTTGEASGRQLIPIEQVSRTWSVRFGLVWLGVWGASLVPIQLALPAQLLDISPRHHVGNFALVNGAVGLVAIATLPVFGALCDRTKVRFGARRSWVLGGLVVFAVGLVLTGQQTQLGWLTACWALAQAGNNAMATGLTAVVADAVPEEQRGLISGVIYAPQALAVVIGLVALTALSDGRRYLLLYALLALALAVLTVPFLVRYRDRAVLREDPITPRTILAALYIPVKANPDYTWAFWSRLLVNVGNALGTTYLLFFLRDYLHVSDPEGSLLPVVGIYLVFTLVATVLGGLLSDRLGRRRPFVAVAASLQGAAGILVAIHPSFTTTLVAGALLGAGYGAYMSVDQALITAVLPDPADRAKDLGTMNIGSVGPQMFGPVLASAVIVLASYRVLFLAAGLFTLLGTWMVYRIKSVR
jgi:MFS family permease